MNAEDIKPGMPARIEIDLDNDPRLIERRNLPARGMPPIEYLSFEIDDRVLVFALRCRFSAQIVKVAKWWGHDQNDVNRNSAFDDAVSRLNHAWKRFKESEASV